MREEVWYLRARVHFNVHYWALFASRIKKIEIVVRVVLGIGTVASLVAFASSPQLAFWSTVVSFCCAFIACVIIPAFGLDIIVGKVENVHHRWVDIRKVVDAMWSEVEGSRTVSKQSLNAARNTINEIGKITFWFSDCKGLQEKAGEMRDISLIN